MFACLSNPIEKREQTRYTVKGSSEKGVGAADREGPLRLRLWITGGKYMCVALPGRVLSISENHAKVDFSGNIIDVHAGAVTAAPGDYVLVHAGCAIEVLSRENAAEILSVFAELDRA
jgi:hydrogenase expression/formation protein HypC